METRCESSKALISCCFSITITLFFIAHTAVSVDDQSANCVLNFTSFPYQPTGYCVGKQDKIKTWGGFPTTVCCRNALTTLSKALALQATVGDGKLFVNQHQFEICSIQFDRQSSVSINSCGFNKLFYGGSQCSGLALSTVVKELKYRDALNKCGQLNLNPSFDDTCRGCTDAVVAARNALLENFGAAGNDTEKAVCAVAVVISIAASKLNDYTFLDDFYHCLPALDVSEPGYFKLKYSVAKTALAIFIAIFGMMLIIMLIKFVTKDKNKQKQQVRKKEIATWSGLYRFSKAEIEAALDFSNERKSLGRGSAGQVFKGILPSGQVVAIKQIYKSNTSDSFTREVEGLSRVRHPNLVCLFGCCTEDNEQYLVYEYCSAGNLAQHLLKKDTVLTWERRVKILRDCALALRYLHHYIDGCIVHRDIKLTNILLTENLDPKLSDFGLAKILGMEESKVFTDVRGTIGYMDPEYMSNAKLTCASDIYSFGIVALQLLSGQKVIELDLEARDQLTRKAKDVSMGKRPLTDFEDPRLNGILNSVDFESILQIAVLCAAKSSKGRPTIDVVFDELDKVLKNTVADIRGRRELSSSATPQSRSIEILRV